MKEYDFCAVNLIDGCRTIALVLEETMPVILEALYHAGLIERDVAENLRNEYRD